MTSSISVITRIYVTFVNSKPNLMVANSTFWSLHLGQAIKLIAVNTVTIKIIFFINNFFCDFHISRKMYKAFFETFCFTNFIFHVSYSFYIPCKLKFQEIFFSDNYQIAKLDRCYITSLLILSNIRL